MGDTLMGGTESGTPLETRRGARNLGRAYAGLFSNGYGAGVLGAAAPFQRGAAAAAANTLGFSPGMLDLEGLISSLITSPEDATAGLFSAMQPFEEQETARQVGGTRSLFSTMGGRFSRNIMGAEATTRGQLASEFQRNRQSALLSANQQRIAALGTILPAIIQARQQAFNEMFMPTQLATSFLQPGAPVVTGGMLPGLIGAGATLGGALLAGPPGAAAGGAVAGAAPLPTRLPANLTPISGAGRQMPANYFPWIPAGYR